MSQADSGIGIPPEKLASIFEPFVQVDTTLTRNREGVRPGTRHQPRSRARDGRRTSPPAAKKERVDLYPELSAVDESRVTMPGRIATRLVCPACGIYSDERSAHSTCVNCDTLLDLEVESGLTADAIKANFRARRATMRGPDRSGVWRYREMVLPTISDPDIVSYPEGNTPLIDSQQIADFAGGARLTLKHEGMNPTGSFKDRGMTVAISQAKRIGAHAVACASTGNTSASLAAYAAMAGLPGLVLLPAGKISSGKLAQTLAHGARTIQVRGSFDDCLRLLREASDALGVYVVNSVNPFRLAGQRTIVFELLDQLDWAAPDWISLPAGNLGNTSAFGDALRDAVRLGLIPRAPRLLAVQAAGASPFEQAFRGGFTAHPTVDPETVATAIRIGAPASWDRGVQAIRNTDGFVAAVTDAEILDAKRAIDAAGVGCEPASAASVAGVRKLRQLGIIRDHERVVAVLTGHVLKDTGIIVEHAAPTVEIEPTLDALQKTLG